MPTVGVIRLVQLLLLSALQTSLWAARSVHNPNFNIPPPSDSLDERQPSFRSQIDAFRVMEILAKANEMEAAGESICHMEIGQPGHGAPKAVLEAAHKALDNNCIGYTSALGITALKQAIAQHYQDKYGIAVDPHRVVVCTGSSAAFMLTFLGCFEEGDHVALCSSGYPCYRNLLTATGLRYVSIPVNDQFKVTGPMLEEEIARRASLNLPPLKGLLLSSPGNPTGVMLSPEELAELCAVCDKHNVLFLSDEIYHGVSYGHVHEASALQFSQKAIAINSFSKYYSMTGWRLGWMVVPLSLVDTMNRLSENIYISPPTLSQLAACEAFKCDKELDAHVAVYACNRDIVLDCLGSLGLLSCAAPSDGAFYVYVDLMEHGVDDSAQLCERLLQEAKLAVTPGLDFEDPATSLGKHRLRFSYSRGTEEVREGMQRFKKWWLANMPDKRTD